MLQTSSSQQRPVLELKFITSDRLSMLQLHILVVSESKNTSNKATTVTEATNNNTEAYLTAYVYLMTRLPIKKSSGNKIEITDILQTQVHLQQQMVMKYSRCSS